MARSVGIPTKLSHFLPQEALLNLYYSLIHSQLLYALPVWCATYKTYLIKVKRLQNKTIRAVTKTKYTESITPQYKKLQISKLDDLFIFEIAKLMYLFIHNKMPDRFKHYFTYSKIKSNLHYTRRITPKRVTSCGAHLRGLAPGQHSSEETSQRSLATLCRFDRPRPPAPIACA